MEGGREVGLDGILGCGVSLGLCYALWKNGGGVGCQEGSFRGSLGESDWVRSLEKKNEGKEQIGTPKEHIDQVYRFKLQLYRKFKNHY